MNDSRYGQSDNRIKYTWVTSQAMDGIMRCDCVSSAGDDRSDDPCAGPVAKQVNHRREAGLVLPLEPFECLTCH